MHRQQPKPSKTMNLLEENPHDWALLKNLIPDMGAKSHIPGGPIEGVDDIELTHDMLVRPRSSLPFERRYALIVDTVGEGACGSVFGVQEVAENVYGSPEKVSSPRVAKMMKLEDAKKEIQHSPRHLGMKRIIVSGERAFIIMRRMPGKPLSDEIKNLKRKRLNLTPVQLINLMAVILETIRDQVHAHGFVHRDIKPANIMVDHPDTDYPVVNIIDYGYAKDAKYIDVKEAYGSPDYMPLESATFKGTTEKSDVYSAGVTLLELAGVSIWNASVPEASRKRLDYPVPDDFPNLLGLEPTLKKRVKSLIHAMTRSDQDGAANKRCDLNKAIMDCNMIRLLAKSAALGLGSGDERLLHDAYSAASDARSNLRKAKNTTDLRELLLAAANRVNEAPFTFDEFIQSLRFSSLSWCKTKSEFVDAVDSVISEYENAKSMMSDALLKARRFSEICRTDKLYDCEYMRKIADQQASVLSRKLDKLNILPMDLDSLAFHTEKYCRLAMNVYTPYEMKMKYMSEEIIREINTEIKPEDEKQQIVDVVAKISEKCTPGDDMLVQVRQAVRLMLMQFISDYVRQPRLRMFGDAEKADLFDMIESLMRDIKSTSRLDDVFRLLKDFDAELDRDGFSQGDLQARIRCLCEQYEGVPMIASHSL